MNDQDFNALPAAKPEPDRLPPHSIEAEMGALGCVLCDARIAADTMLEFEKAGVVPEWFYDLRHRTIYEHLTALRAGAGPLDTVSLAIRLRERKQVEAVGGMVYVGELPDATPSAANLGYYLDILRAKFVLRKLCALGAELAGRVENWTGEVPALVDAVYSEFDAIARALVIRDKGRVKPIKEVLHAATHRWEQLKAGTLRGIQTGFTPIDYVGGLLPGEMVLIAGETKIGKSTLALNMLHGALKTGVKASVFSLEMSDQAWLDRLLSLDLQIDRRAFRNRSFLTDAVCEKLGANVARLSKLPLWICDDASLNAREMERALSKLVLSDGIGLFVVDYAQLVSPQDDRENREQQVARIGRDIRRICQTHGLVCLVLSQLNDDGKVRESRALLHECHVAFILEEKKGELWVRQAAGRDVAVPSFPVEFDGTTCRMQQKSQIETNSPHND